MNIEKTFSTFFINSIAIYYSSALAFIIYDCLYVYKHVLSFVSVNLKICYILSIKHTDKQI